MWARFFDGILQKALAIFTAFRQTGAAAVSCVKCIQTRLLTVSLVRNECQQVLSFWRMEFFHLWNNKCDLYIYKTFCFLYLIKCMLEKKKRKLTKEMGILLLLSPSLTTNMQLADNDGTEFSLWLFRLAFIQPKNESNHCDHPRRCFDCAKCSHFVLRITKKI